MFISTFSHYTGLGGYAVDSVNENGYGRYYGLSVRGVQP
jgi:hypothetical protein